MQKKIIVSLVIVAIFVTTFIPLANASSGNCYGRYATLVNPVRGRQLWIDKSLKPLNDQYLIAQQNKVPVTWLLAFDVLEDKELVDSLRGFDKEHELGVFLEINPRLAEQSRVIYPHGVSWFSPRAVFLSGYSRSERRKLIDKLFAEFKNTFGQYPKSVGAWWIDSYSLNYMKEKYDIKAAMIVADQKTTDNYGVWGQWWGVAYYPAKANILTSASDLSNKQDVVVIQWAQRDPLLAYGEGPAVSNYSLQANDYIRQKKDTDYFKNLVDVYLDCRNPLGQVTIGLETGIESVGYIEEYEKQLKLLKNREGLEPVTMSEFADKFAKVYPQFPKGFVVGDKESGWDLTTQERKNSKLDDYIKYNPQVSFSDYFLADKSDFLDRVLAKEQKQTATPGQPWFLGVLALLGLFLSVKKKFLVWIVGSLFAIAAFGLILRSYSQFGWLVYFGALVPSLPIVQILVVVLSFGAVLLLNRVKGVNIWLLPLTFGLDWFLSVLRFTYMSGKYYLGFTFDDLRFVGLSFEKPIRLLFVNQDFPAAQAAAFLRFDFSRVWDNLWLSLVAYPLIHILLAAFLGLILLRVSPMVRKIILVTLMVLLAGHLVSIWQSDPRVVLPNLLR